MLDNHYRLLWRKFIGLNTICIHSFRFMRVCRIFYYSNHVTLHKHAQKEVGLRRKQRGGRLQIKTQALVSAFETYTRREQAPLFGKRVDRKPKCYMAKNLSKFVAHCHVLNSTSPAVLPRAFLHKSTRCKMHVSHRDMFRSECTLEISHTQIQY